jgi:D-alanyl-D-alanine carboxypeptidase (penicillin-binding protein 5/6)
MWLSFRVWESAAFLKARNPLNPKMDPSLDFVELRMTRRSSKDKATNGVSMKFLRPILILSLLFTHTPDLAHTIDLEARHAILIDLTTNTILFEKNADEPVPPSSMSKIMTVFMVFEALKKGQLRLDDEFTISKKAWKTGGSRMFIEVNSRVKIKDLLRGVIVQSGNDAAVALAETLGGTEEDFAELMNKKARDLGAKNASFANATGLPNENHKMSARDLSVIALRTLGDFPDLYPLYAEKEFTYNNITQPNRNPLLSETIGCDGMKTGFTDKGGYGLVASAIQNGRRLLMVMNGCPTAKVRAAEAKSFMTWGFRYFASPVLFQAGQTIDTADVWLGKQKKIPLVCEQDVVVTVPRSDLDKVTIQAVYKTPLEAPVKVGDPVGKLIVTVLGKPPREYPLLAGEESERVGFFSRIGAAFNYLVYGS